MRRRTAGRGLPAALIAGALALLVAACSSAVAPGIEDAADAVEEPAAPALTAPFTITPATPTTGEAVTFDARPVGCTANPCTYEWHDVNKGTWPLGTGEVLTFTFSGAGVKSVRLTVTDAAGATRTHRFELEVYAPGLAPALDAPFTTTPATPTTGDAVTFDARPVGCTADPCTYEWHDVNQGTWPLGTGEVLTFTFSGAGMKTVRLTVTDATGESTTRVADVEVFAPGLAPAPEPELPADEPAPDEPVPDEPAPEEPATEKPAPEEPTGPPSADKLAWAPPAGYESFRVVDVPVRGGIGTLNNSTDYLLVMPSSPRRQPLTIDGGRHVVVIGGEIDVEDAKTGPESAFRGIMVRGGSVNGRIVHLEGLKIHSSGGTISDGINTSAGDSRFVLQVQNVRIGPLPRAYTVGSENHHPDVIQTWGSVGEIRIDRLTGISDYQGLFFKADFNGAHGDIDIRRTNIRGLGDARYLLWLSDKGGRWPNVALDGLWIEPRPGREFGRSIWPDSGSSSHAPTISDGSATWSSLPVKGAVRLGLPSGGDFVPEGSVGIGYRSPGYR